MLRGYLLCLIGCLLSCCTLLAQIMPSDPVLDFRLPRFAANGYPQWILNGGKGMYDSAEQIRVEEMSLRVYSGDERRALEMTIDSPKATFFTKENRADSDSSIEIVGANFKVSGVGWTWDSTRKEIEVKSEVLVEFSQEVVGMLSGRALDGVDKEDRAGEERMTEIASNRLLLKTTPEAYNFQFIESVEVISDDTRLKCELLVAIADAPSGDGSEDASVAELEFDSIDKIIATEQVVISQAGNLLKAGKATFSLREQSAEFEGNPSIETSGAYLAGHFIRSERGKVIVNGSEVFGRAQMIVHKAGGLGVSSEVSLDQETKVFAETIKMEELETENQFTFEGSVEATSGSMRVRADLLDLYLDPAIDDTANDTESAATENRDKVSDFRLGEVVRVIGNGSVYIEQENQVATCDRVVFYPREEQALLTGSPRVEHEQAIISGYSMELKRGFAVVNGSHKERAQVILPELPDLGADNLQLMDGMQISEREETAAEETEITASETIVKAETLMMIEKPDHYLLNFTDSVSVEGTNLKAFCNRMDVILVDHGKDSDREKQMQVQTINAYEDILFEQNGRTATADKVTIKPEEGEVVLEGNAVLTDVQGQVFGNRITLHKGKGRATVEGDGTDKSRARIVLPEVELPKGFPGGD